MEKNQESLQALAEAVAGPARELAAGLLLRPSPLSGHAPADITALCRKIQALLEDALPAMQESMEALEDADIDDLDEIVDELASPAFDFVDLARSLWEATLPTEAEGVRPLLATLVEAPAAHLLEWMLEIIHAAVDPWAVFEEPEEPVLEYALDIQDGPVREALRLWRQQHPNVLPGDFSI